MRKIFFVAAMAIMVPLNAAQMLREPEEGIFSILNEFRKSNSMTFEKVYETFESKINNHSLVAVDGSLGLKHLFFTLYKLPDERFKKGICLSHHQEFPQLFFLIQKYCKAFPAEFYEKSMQAALVSALGTPHFDVILALLEVQTQPFLCIAKNLNSVVMDPDSSTRENYVRAIQRFETLVVKLLEKGKDINEQDECGRTVFTLLDSSLYEHAIPFLLNANANPDIQSYDEKTIRAVHSKERARGKELIAKKKSQRTNLEEKNAESESDIDFTSDSEDEMEFIIDQSTLQTLHIRLTAYDDQIKNFVKEFPRHPYYSMAEHPAIKAALKAYYQRLTEYKKPWHDCVATPLENIFIPNDLVVIILDYSHEVWNMPAHIPEVDAIEQIQRQHLYQETTHG